MKALDLFSGIGGFSLGLERAGIETIAFCEIEDYPVSILNKHWPNVPVYRDIRKLDGTQFRNKIEVVCGGFPCQPFSVAGQQKGKKDDRHLWPEMLRIIKESKPTWVIGENVAGFIKMALDDVCLDLENEGFTTIPFNLPACSVGGIHRRERIFFVAYSEYNGLLTTKIRASKQETVQRSSKGSNETIESKRVCITENVADTIGKGLEGFTRNEQDQGEGSQETRSTSTSNFSRDWQSIRFPTEPPIRSGDDGFPDHVARLKALGNAVVPQIPELIGRAIMAVSA